MWVCVLIIIIDNTIEMNGTQKCEYSDHSILKLETGVKINQLNVAQLGRLQIFQNDEIPEGFNWSCTLRTVTILKQLISAKQDLVKLGLRLLVISGDSSLSLEEKNTLIEKESYVIFDDLKTLGFSVKSFKLVPNKLFNTGVSSNLLRQNPDDYVKGPAFVLEDTASFSDRMENGFDEMFEDGPDIITAQEIELGESDGIDFTNIHNSMLGRRSLYDYVTPFTQDVLCGTTCVTYYNNHIFENVSLRYEDMLCDIKTKMKCFGDNDLKVVVVVLEHKHTGDIIIIVNIHADYTKANTEESWTVLRELFGCVRNLIVSGDFNLKLNNKSYFENAFADFEGRHTLLQTPEPVEIGNPTYDLIITNCIN